MLKKEDVIYPRKKHRNYKEVGAKLLYEKVKNNEEVKCYLPTYAKGKNPIKSDLMNVFFFFLIC